MLTHRTSLTVLAALVLAAPFPLRAQEEQQQKPGTIVSVLEAQGNYTTLVKAIRTAGLAETLEAAGPYTLFAPTDEAFAKLPQAERDALLADADALKEVLSAHTVSTTIRSTDVTESMNAKTIDGNTVQIVRDGETLKLQTPAPAAEVGGTDAEAPAPMTTTVVKADIEASNGLIHAVDTVLRVDKR